MSELKEWVEDRVEEGVVGRYGVPIVNINGEGKDCTHQQT